LVTLPRVREEGGPPARFVLSMGNSEA
jgi:hypothetical protein